jgi:hypothetical protein
MASCSTQKEQGTPLKVYAETEGCFKKSRLLRQCLVLIGSMPVFIAGRDNIVWGGERSRVLPRCVAYPPPPIATLGGNKCPPYGCVDVDSNAELHCVDFGPV